MSDESKLTDYHAISRRWAEFRGWRQITPDNPWPSAEHPKWTEGWTNEEIAQCPDPPPFDKSVDALLSSLPDGWEIQIAARVHEGKPHVNIWIDGNRYAEGVTGKDKQQAIAHALLMACVAVADALSEVTNAAK